MTGASDLLEAGNPAVQCRGGDVAEFQRPPTKPEPLPKIVSLFSGAGGLDLGFKQAGYSIAVAIDASEAAIQTHRRNFRRTKAIAADLVELQPNGVLQHVKAKIPAGEQIGVIGGPPCQGFSRANNLSEAQDPRNELPTLYLEIVRQLQLNYSVEFIVFENVLGIRDKKHADTYEALLAGIEELGFDVTEKILCATDFGVPQTRERVVLSGMRQDRGYTAVRPRKRKGIATVREAIGHLAKPVFFKRGLKASDIRIHPNHWTMQPKSARFAEPQEYENPRSFKRLEWDSPSRTIAFGHREIHVHPNGRRRLSIYESMLLQGFPESFVLRGNLSEQVEQISNAVPPPVARSVARAVTRALRGR